MTYKVCRTSLLFSRILFIILIVVMRAVLSGVLCLFRLLVLCQAEDGIRDLVRSRGLGDVYKRQFQYKPGRQGGEVEILDVAKIREQWNVQDPRQVMDCLLYTSDAADERSSVDLGGRRIINKKKTV